MAEPGKHYDLIVIGAGPGGSAVAAKASADPAVEVLLLELGPDWRVSEAPDELYAHGWTAYAGLAAMAPFQSMDVMARKNADAEPGMYFAGRGIGGSSNINGQLCVRPPLDEYDAWAALGATRWSGPMAEALWKRVENDRDFGHRPEHGDSGPLSIERSPRDEWTELDSAFWRASVDQGYEVLEDMNDGSGRDGLAPMPFSRKDGRRVTANHAYIEPIRDRANLTVRGDARVDRVLLSPGGSRAAGVRVQIGDRSRTISSERVVICAGTLGSAGILLRSGVGPAVDLRALGIKPIHDLPVGCHIQDHTMFQVCVDWHLLDEVRELNTNFCSCALRYSTGLRDAPAGDMFLLPVGPVTLFGIDFAPSVSVWPWETCSRGSLRLHSADPDRWPDVNLGIWSDGRDVVRMRAGVRRAVELLDSPAFTRLGGTRRTAGSSGMPLCDVDDDAALDAQIRAFADTQAHVSCSAPMGEPGGEMAVVDPDAKVIGVENLWVADLSICPKVVRCGPYPTAMVIGEFVADIVCADIGARPVARASA